jgi:DNA-binding response OmpR family regulator
VAYILKVVLTAIYFQEISMTNILLVDEERSVRQAIKFELENEGFLVIDVDNFAEAFSAFNAFKCNLVISDISDLNDNGKRMLETFKNVPFIALSTFPNSQLSGKNKLLLKDRYFEKPFPMNELISKVHEALNSQCIFADAV